MCVHESFFVYFAGLLNTLEAGDLEPPRIISFNNGTIACQHSELLCYLFFCVKMKPGKIAKDNFLSKKCYIYLKDLVRITKI